MKKNPYRFLCRVSLGMLMISVTLRFLLGWFRNLWISTHLGQQAAGLTYLKDTQDDSVSVYVTCPDKKCRKKLILEDCTDLFYQLTWVDILRKVLAGFAALGMGSSLFLRFFFPTASKEEITQK